MDEITVPIYLLTGFLESGKTSFLDFTLQQDYFYIEGKTLLILCEEGYHGAREEVLHSQAQAGILCEVEMVLHHRHLYARNECKKMCISEI